MIFPQKIDDFRSVQMLLMEIGRGRMGYAFSVRLFASQLFDLLHKGLSLSKPLFLAFLVSLQHLLSSQQNIFQIRLLNAAFSSR